MNHKSIFYMVGTTILIFVLAGIPLCAQTQDDEWQFTVAPYLLIPGMSGTLGIRVIETDVNASASDIFSNLQFGIAGYGEARKGNWGFATDLMFTALGGYSDNVNVDPTQGAYTFLGVRRLAPGLDLNFGVRWNVIQGKITFKEDVGLIPEGTVIEETKQWVDPVVGIRWSRSLGKRLEFILPASIGGFYIGSKIALDVAPNLQFQVAKNIWLGGGWRVIYVNYESGYEDGAPALGENAFRWDMITTGPVIGMTFKF